MPLKQGSNALVTKLPFQTQDKPALGTARPFRAPELRTKNLWTRGFFWSRHFCCDLGLPKAKEHCSEHSWATPSEEPKKSTPWVGRTPRGSCNRTLLRRVLTLSFLCFFWENGRENHQKKQGLILPTEPLKSLEKKGKTLKKTRKSSQGEKTRHSKKTRKGRIG